MEPIIFSRLLFSVAITLAAVIGVAFFIPELQGPQGSVHPVFSSMQRGGDPVSGFVIWLGWAFGAGVIVLIFSMVALGTARGKSFRGIGWPLISVFVATIAAWIAVVVAYQNFVSNPEQSLLFGWPLPTGLMIFVMLPVMFLINIVFVIYFPRSVLAEEDTEKFEKVFKEQNKDDAA